MEGVAGEQGDACLRSAATSLRRRPRGVLRQGQHMRELTGEYALPYQVQSDRMGHKALGKWYDTMGIKYINPSAPYINPSEPYFGAAGRV